MKLRTVCLVATLWVGCAGHVFAQGKQPTIVLNGGNGMGLEITAPVIEMAGGTRAVVAVVIHAEGPGNQTLDDWKRGEPIAKRAAEIGRMLNGLIEALQPEQVELG